MVPLSLPLSVPKYWLILERKSLKSKSLEHGDDARRQEPFLKDVPGAERSGLFLYLNMNKLGITLNPGTATGKRIFSELLKNADIFIENNPPKRMKELELSYRYVKQINPRIVMTSITPFGQTGPYKDYESCELVNTHMGGVGHISIEKGILARSRSSTQHIFSVSRPV